MHYSVITGATSGLGLAFAECLAGEGRNLILIARHEETLSRVAEELRASYQIDVETISADLSDETSLQQLVSILRSREIDVLINNAGFGIYEPFGESAVEKEVDLIKLTMLSTMVLCHELIPNMLKNSFGLVINVGSLAGWLSASTYSAAKSWTKVFTEYLAFEYRDSHIKFSCLAPGYINTKFHESAGNSVSSIPSFLISHPNTIAQKALVAGRKGKVVYVPTFAYRCVALIVQYAPRPMVRLLSSLR
jgi:short-subunit dehydrogenase